MAYFIVYDSVTGEIKRTGSCPLELVSLQKGDGESVFESQNSISDTEYWVNAGELEAKQISKITYTISGFEVIFNDIPDYSFVKVSGDATAYGPIGPGTDTVTFSESGDYSIKIKSPSELDFFLDISV